MGLLSRLFAPPKQGVAQQRASAPPHRAEPVFAVIDVETTGLSPRSHRIIELAIVRLDASGHVLDEWVQRFNPQGPVGATHIHGITDADVADAPLFADVLPTINLGLSGTVLVAHNARFDTGFLAAEYERAGWDLPQVPTVCTMEASRHYLPALERRRLVDCCAAVGVRNERAHSALADARATGEVLASWLPRRPAMPELEPCVHRRTATSWPSGPARAPMPMPAAPPSSSRRATSAPPYRVKPTPTSLGSLLRQIRFSADVPDGTPGKVELEQYAEKLLEVLDDGVLDPEELASLSDLAELYDLSPEAVDGAHHVMVEALVFLALTDGKVSRAERDEVARLSAQLGVSESDLPGMYEEARERRFAAIEAEAVPLPSDWALGEPLRVGAKVVFTGGDPDLRTQLESVAPQRGIEVMPSVSRFTTLLVSDGLDSGKAGDARRLGTRVVTYREFVELLRHVQPRV